MYDEFLFLEQTKHVTQEGRFAVQEIRRLDLANSNICKQPGRSEGNPVSL